MERGVVHRRGTLDFRRFCVALARVNVFDAVGIDAPAFDRVGVVRTLNRFETAGFRAFRYPHDGILFVEQLGLAERLQTT